MQQYADVVTDLHGNVVPRAIVSILNLDGSLASLYAPNETTPIANPVIADNLGYFTFKAANGNYTRSVTASGITRVIPGEIVLSNGAGVGGGTAPTTASAIANVTSGGLSASTVQAALNELDSEKLSLTQMASAVGSALVGWHGSAGRTVEQMLDMLALEKANITDPKYGGGADVNGVADSWPAMQAAVDSGAYIIHGPKGRYKLGQTLMVTTKFRLQIDFANSGIANPNLLWYGPASTSGSKYAMIQFYGPNADSQNLNFSLYLGGLSLDGFAGGSNRSAIGIAFGDLKSNYNQLIKNVRSSDISVTGCRVGVMFGMNLSMDADIANHVHSNWRLYRNTDYGILAGSVNLAAVNFIGTDFASNGYAPTNDSADIHPLNEDGCGANVCLRGGEIVFTGCQSNHAGDVAFKPATADIYMPGRIGFAGTSLKINGWWSDVWGRFLYQKNDAHCLSLTGVRHWEGAMNDGTTGIAGAATPVSIQHQAKLSGGGCYLFGDIQSDAGMGGSVSLPGTTFHADVTLRPALGQGTYKGSLINTAGPRKADAFFSELSAQAVNLQRGPALAGATWTNGSYQTFTSSGSAITSAINTSGTTYATSAPLADGTLVAGRRYRVTFTLTLNSGQAPIVRLQDSASTDIQALPALAAGVNSVLVTGMGSEIKFTATNTAPANWSATYSIAEIPLAVAGSTVSMPGSSGGVVATCAEATGTPSGTTNLFAINVNVPAGARITGVQLRVDADMASGQTWSAIYTGGSSLAIAPAGQGIAKNTMVNKMHAAEITTALTQVRITSDAGNFTNGTGTIRAIVYYETFIPMSTLP